MVKKPTKKNPVFFIRRYMVKYMEQTYPLSYYLFIYFNFS